LSLSGEQFGVKAMQRGDVVHVVPHRQHGGFDADLAGSLHGLREDQRRAPSNVLKQTAMRVLQPDQVIAAIFRRTENDPVAGSDQFSCGIDKQRGR
jgi:hypothetical protein